MTTDDEARTEPVEPDEDSGNTGGKLREWFGTGSLTGGAATGGTGGTGGLGTGAGDMSGGSSSILGPDPTTGGEDGVDETGAGPA